MNQAERHLSHKLFLGSDVMRWWGRGLELVDDFFSELEFDVVDQALVVGQGVVQLLFVEVLFVHTD